MLDFRVLTSLLNRVPYFGNPFGRITPAQPPTPSWLPPTLGDFEKIFRTMMGFITPRNTPFISRWNNPLILTFCDHFLGHPSTNLTNFLVNFCLATERRWFACSYQTTFLLVVVFWLRVWKCDVSFGYLPKSVSKSKQKNRRKKTTPPI